ncbi:hypothetical protein BASA83_000306 [Batrachochytrium salamandrivorans]|nr:hypothetical protein BASA83_000306 [Batrachochytrium salamandrivorans]
MLAASTPVDTWNKGLNTTLEAEDKEIYDLVQQEKWRQFSCLELIASENFTSQAVMEANGSALTNKYSEGLPGARYYGALLWIYCQLLRPDGLLSPHDRIMGLDLPSGGHLTHGYATAKKKVSSSAIYFESLPYQVDMSTGFIDYDKLETNALLFRPRLIICGASAYPREFDYARLRKIADTHGAYLMCDIAHISGLVAAKEAANPFEYCDIVTTTTHKTLRGPRAGLIFFQRAPKGEKNSDLEEKVNFSVFPSNQGGPHNNTIAGIAVALKQAGSPEFKLYAKQVRLNAVAVAEALKGFGYKLVTEGPLTSGKLIKDFVSALAVHEDVITLKADVEKFAHSFPMPGFDPNSVPIHARH